MKFLESSAVISPCERYRYVLRRRWKPGPTILWILHNPSVADAIIPDPTLRKGVGFSDRWGFGALVYGNLFALRATDSKEVPKAGLVAAIGPENDHWLDLLIGEHEHVILAWGALNPKMVEQRMPALAALLEKHHRAVWCLGTSQHGQPLHPLMLGYDTERQVIHHEP